MTATILTSSNVSVNYPSATHSCARISSTFTASQENTPSTNSSATDSPRVSHPRSSRGSRHTPDPCRPQLASSSSNSSSSSSAALVDHESGVIFSDLYTASGERITTHEFQSKPRRVLAPTLRLVIPSSSSSSSSSLPSFALTLPSPISPTRHPSSSIPPLFSPFTRASYLAAAARAPPSSRVPSLPPKRCPHTPFQLPCATAAVPPPRPSRCCALCSLQQLACEIWWGSRGPMLCAPQLPAAASTPTTRAVYYALGLPLGRLERACVDLDVVAVVSFMRQPPRISSSSRSVSNSNITGGVKSKRAVAVAVTRAPAPSRILRVFVRRALYVLSAPTRVPRVSIPIKPRRRIVTQP